MEAILAEDKPKPGDKVILKRLPPGLLDGLPEEDQLAIRDIVDKPVRLVSYDEDGRAEVEFTDAKEQSISRMWTGKLLFKSAGRSARATRIQASN